METLSEQPGHLDADLRHSAGFLPLRYKRFITFHVSENKQTNKKEQIYEMALKQTKVLGECKVITKFLFLLIFNP